MYRPAPVDGRLFGALIGGIIALAWIALVVWDRSPYANFLDHRQLQTIQFAADGEALVFAAAFVSGWTLMVFAMMLPTSLPLLQMFYRMTARRTNRARLVSLVVAGYIAVWAAFGAGAHIFDWVLHQQLVNNFAWLNEHAKLIAATTLLLAGVYQFTPLKYHCLDKCRSPLTFINEHWHGANAPKEALNLGVRHGIFCVGCCWSLMVVMFALGVGNLGWMLLLGSVMAVEKNVRWGWRLSGPLGVGLIAAAALVMIVPGPEVTCAC
jgi:predicted metal-binding membrane protein